MSCAMMFASAFSASAFPVQELAKSPSLSTGNVLEIRNRPHRRPPPHHRPPHKRPKPRPGHHNGYHGSHHYQHGYHRHSDGWWYPLAAFGAGAIIGGAVVSQPPSTRYDDINPRHVEWCTNRYRTYRAYDNSYAPQVGVRAQCYSPYY